MRKRISSSLMVLTVLAFPGLGYADHMVIEPAFNKTTETAGILLSQAMDDCNPLVPVTFTVGNPSSWPVTQNDCMDIFDIHLKILGPEGVNFGDANHNDMLGDGDIFSSVAQSADFRELTLSEGVIRRGESFKPLFLHGNEDVPNVRIEAFFTVPEPPIFTLFGVLAAALLGVGLRRRSLKDRS